MAKANRKSTAAAAKTAPVIFIDPALAPDLYASIVIGDCMAPLHPEGSAVLVDKRQPCESGDLVLIYLRPGAAKPGYVNCMFKRLVSIPPWVPAFPFKDHPKSEVHAIATAEMLHPPRRIYFRCSDILAVHRVVGPLPPNMKITGSLPAQVHASDVSKGGDLTRRSVVMNALIGTAATLPAIPMAAKSAAALAHPDAALFALEEQFAAAYRKSQVVAPSWAAVEKAIFAWERSDPQPSKRSGEPDATMTKQDDGTLTIVLPPTKPEEKEAALLDHAKAMEEWDARREAALANCKYEEVAGQWDEAMDEVNRILDEIANCRARTLEGLECKARIAGIDRDAASDVTHSITDDLLAMQGMALDIGERDDTDEEDLI